MDRIRPRPSIVLFPKELGKFPEPTPPLTRRLTAAATALQEGKDALEVLRRQRIVGQLYPAAQSVMDAEASRAFEDAAESVIDPVGGAGR